MTTALKINLLKVILILAFTLACFVLIKSALAEDKPSNMPKRPNITDKLATKEAALKAKLDKFRDQKKASAAARISENLNKINTNQTNQMGKYLANMTTILDKLEKRVNQLSPDIKDPALAKAVIASAREAIASASSAVSTQSQKDYTIQVGSEATVRADAKKMRDELHTDLLSVRRLVIDAKQAVSNAIRVAKSGKLEIPKEGSSSATK